jgi:hypothetical protein
MTSHAGVAMSAAVPRGIAPGELLALSTRLVLLLTAAFFAAIGFATLTGPLAVPFTVMLWLCAAAFAGLAVFWTIPNTGVE